MYHLKFNLKVKLITKLSAKVKNKKQKKSFDEIWSKLIMYSDYKRWATQHPELLLDPVIDKYKNEIITLIGKHC